MTGSPHPAASIGKSERRVVVDGPANRSGSIEGAGGHDLVHGVCHAVYAFDIAFSINLDEAERAIAAISRRAEILKKKRAPQSIQQQEVPLSITEPTPAIEIAGCLSASTVDIVLYSFGAASVRFSFALDNSLEELVGLSEALYDRGELARQARQHLERLVEPLGGALAKPRIAPPVEDYVLFEITRLPDENVEQFLSRRRGILARILRAEHAVLSSQEVADALAQTIAYGETDAAVIDWHAAMLVGPDAHDVRSILEYANVQLVQMRSLDDELERILDSSYELMARFKGVRQTFPGVAGGELRRLAVLHADSAVLFEAATHSMKLVGDQYLSRVYRAVSQRFHLPQWGANINRKLETIDRIYDKMTDRQATLRLELLEWIIIILILIEVVKGFLPA